MEQRRVVAEAAALAGRQKVRPEVVAPRKLLSLFRHIAVS
jgi:hypothetical protein